MPADPVARLIVAFVLYTAISLYARRPSPTPLDFRDATAPGYLLLLVAVAILLLAVLAPFPLIGAPALVRGYAAGLAFVAVPQLVGMARRECVHQFEIRNLYPMRNIFPRELLLCGVTFPAIAACEEVVFRGVIHLPEPLVALAQWVVYVAGYRRGLGAVAISCAFLAALHQRTGSLAVVIGAHAALHTLTGRLRSPGLFTGVYPLLEQARWRNLAPGWWRAVVEMVTGVFFVALAK